MPVWYSTTAGSPNLNIAPGFEIVFAPVAGPAALELSTNDDAGTGVVDSASEDDAVSDEEALSDDAVSDVEVPASEDAVLDAAIADEAVDKDTELMTGTEGCALLISVALAALSELAVDALLV